MGLHNPEWYKMFCAVAEKGGFSAAAKQLYLSQPAVSQGVKQLETALGARLFERKSKGVVLTREGETLYSYAKQALALLEAGEQRILDMKQLLLGELAIGAGDTLSRYFLLPYLEKFLGRYPGIRLRLTDKTSEILLEMVQEGVLDAAFLSFPPGGEDELEAKGLSCLPLMALEDVFVAGKKFAFLGREPISRKEICQYPLILLEKSAAARRFADEAFAQSGLELAGEIEVGSHDLLVSLAKIGLGIACVIRQYLPAEGEDLVTLQLTDPLPTRRMGLVWAKEREKSFVAEAFIGWCRENMPEEG